jgi:hypothetical protein
MARSCLQRAIEELKATTLTTTDAKGYIFDVFRKRVVPLRLFPFVVNDWYAWLPHPDSQGDLWYLVNCFTNHIKMLAPNAAMKATVRLGRHFGLGGKPRVFAGDSPCSRGWIGA